MPIDGYSYCGLLGVLPVSQVSIQELLALKSITLLETMRAKLRSAHVALLSKSILLAVCLASFNQPTE